MKKLLHILLFVPIALFGQEPISYPINEGWNMFGYTGCEITPINDAFQDAIENGSLEATFGIIKDVRGRMWHPELGENSLLTHLTPGQGYMMRVKEDAGANTLSFTEGYCNDITFKINAGWNMVGYTGDDPNNDLVDEINSALESGTIESTFTVIKMLKDILASILCITYSICSRRGVYDVS